MGILVNFQWELTILTELEKNIQVWNIADKKKLYSLETSFSTSGNRIAMSNNESTFVSCSWEEKSIVLHDLNDGLIIWENKLINKIHSLMYSSCNKFIYVQ